MTPLSRRLRQLWSRMNERSFIDPEHVADWLVFADALEEEGYRRLARRIFRVVDRAMRHVRARRRLAAVAGVMHPPPNVHEELERFWLVHDLERLFDAPSTLFRAIVALGVEHDHHESDLYIPDTPRTRALATRYGHRFTRFRSNRDDSFWLDIPFAYDPWWEQRRRPRR